MEFNYLPYIDFQQGMVQNSTLQVGNNTYEYVYCDDLKLVQGVKRINGVESLPYRDLYTEHPCPDLRLFRFMMEDKRMMKIGMVSDGYKRFGEEHYLKMKAHGYYCVDYNMCNTDTFPYSCSEEEMEAGLLKEKALTEAAGIEISQVHGPWRFPPTDDTPEKREVCLGEMQKSIRATAIFGCKNWVVHPIMPYGLKEKDTTEAEKTWELNVEFIRQLLITAREYDVTICLENMPFRNFSISTPGKILELVHTMNDEHFKICLDTGHVAVFPECNLADEVRKLNKEIRALHVHDNNGKTDQHQLTYFGIIDWKAFYAALVEIGYEGCFSLETKLPQALSEELYEELSRL